MKKTLSVIALLLCASAAAAQNTNSSTLTQAGKANTNAAAKRGPVFRSTKEQIKQAQALLKQRGHYAGDETGKLDDATRDALRKFQGAEGIKVTGTLNALTLEKMNIALTDRQKEIKRTQEAAAKPANANSR
ncbi:MAG: peptidoglycan-binding protein [Acidobacteria bacterium]|nr:peptidoglycan-binding protein [Acidobacteriota bacterium]